MKALKYPSHKEIGLKVYEFVDLCMNTKEMHNRESLDVLIADLLYYRSTLPCCSDYMEAGLL